MWGVLFSRWYRDRPSDHPAVNAGELSLLVDTKGHAEAPVSWSKLVRARSVWALGIQWFCHYYGFYFYINWLPLYLYRSRGSI